MASLRPGAIPRHLSRATHPASMPLEVLRDAYATAPTVEHRIARLCDGLDWALNQLIQCREAQASIARRRGGK